MQLKQRDLRGLHVVRGLQPLTSKDLASFSPRPDIARLVSLGLVHIITGGGYGLTEKGHRVLSSG